MSAARKHSGIGGMRGALKDRTRSLHDVLDASLGHGVLDGRGYATFLSAQYAARAPIERWACAHMTADIRPPQTAALLAADLAELGESLPGEAEFVFPANADPLGLGWALGGSSMGNRAMLARRRKAGHFHAERFLSDTAPADYFRSLLPILSEPAGPTQLDAAVLAAEAVFRTFLAAIEIPVAKAAA